MADVDKKDEKANADNKKTDTSNEKEEEKKGFFGFVDKVDNGIGEGVENFTNGWLEKADRAPTQKKKGSAESQNKYGAARAITQESLNTKNAGIYSNDIMNVRLVDSSTGDTIKIYHLNDTSRLAKKGVDPTTDESLIFNTTIPSDLLGQFVVAKDHFNAHSCVEALGLYNTDFIREKVQSLGDGNKDLTTMEHKTVIDDLIFRNYIKGGANPVKYNEDGTTTTMDIKDYDAGYERISGIRGIGLGEASVMNPTFQFNKRDDPRTHPLYPKIGRVYASQIMNNWPVALFQPGRLKYNTGFFNLLGLGGGAGATEALIRSGGEGLTGFLAKCFTAVSDVVAVVGTTASAIFGGSRVCEFRQAKNLYNQYFRFLAMDLAGIMGLYDGTTYHGSVKNLNLDSILCTAALEGGPNKFLNSQYIPFRCSNSIIGSESFSNSMDSNPLMQSMNDTAAENDEAVQGGGGLAGQAKKFALNMAGKASEQAMILSGKGRISLPDVFSSSSFSRSFSCDFKFHYPYGDTMGIFENEYIPFLLLLAMGAPRQTGKLSYTSPFAVRVFVKNHIMITYGMIESLSITRGGSVNDWTPLGYPKTLSVSVQIKDMEPNISLPLASRGPLRAALEVMFPSTGISEYLGTLGGLTLDQMSHNFRKKHLKRAVGMFTGAWAARLDPENFVSVAANTRLGSNVMGLFTSVDLDHMNKLGDMYAAGSAQNQENMMQVKFSTPGFGIHALSLNGSTNKYGELMNVRNEEKKSIEELMNGCNDSPYPV